MRFTSPSRRALGLLAASTIGMSTAVLGVTGVASAASPLLAAGQTITADGSDAFEVGPGVCSIDWVVSGGQGGADTAGTPGVKGGGLDLNLAVVAGDEFDLYPGSAGGAGTVEDEEPVGGMAGDNGFDDEGATDGGSTLTAAGGGGGAGSIVSLYDGSDSYVVLAAFGGDGANGGGDLGGAGQGEGQNFSPDGETTTSTTRTGEGQISATGIACLAPGAPEDLDVVGGNGSAAISFYPPNTDEDVAEVTGYEVRVDDGAWAPLATTTDPDTEAEVGTVPLSNGQSHTVSVRATSAAGPGAAATVTDVLALTPVEAATNLTVTPGVTSVLVSWTAPSGQVGVTGYRAFATPAGAQSSQDTVFCDVPVGVTTCLIGVPAGQAYYVGVATLDESGEPGAFADGQETPVIAAPAVPSSVPTKDDGDLVGPAGPITSVTAGQKLTLQGAGFLPFTTVQLTVFSAPVSLGTVVTDENGAFSVEVTLPANLADGTHNLVATGINPDGTTRNLVITVTVSGGVATLANTGFDTAVPLTGGALALLAGAGLLVGARRRSN